jgi:hypothetical protein
MKEFKESKEIAIIEEVDIVILTNTNTDTN